MSLFVFFISVLIVAQHVLGNHQEQTTADVIASCWYVPWLQGGCQDRLAGSASMDGFISQLALLAWGWGRRVVRSKRGFGLRGYCLEMSLPFL